MAISIKNKADNEVEVIVSGDITSDCTYHEWYNNEDTYPKKIREALKNNENSNVVVRINSGGGDVFSGFAIHNILKSHKGSTKAIVEGLCASSASIIAFGCDEIEMPKNTFLMIHKPSSYCAGDSTDFRKMADTLDTIQKGIVSSYQDKKLENISDEMVSDMVDSETWLTGDEASQYFDIKVVDKIDIVNSVESIKARHIPMAVKKVFAISNEAQKDKNSKNIGKKSEEENVKGDAEKLDYINKVIIDSTLALI